MKTATLKDVCQVSMGQAPDGASYNNSGEGFPLIAGAGDFGEHSPKPKKFTKEPNKLSQANDIILCIRATIGDLNWSDKTYCLGRGVAGLRPKADKLDRHYLWHWLASQKDYLFSQGTGSTFKQISRATIDDLSIPLPPLPEQKRIAAILDKAESLRRKQQEEVRLTEELLRSVFLEMFGDPVTNPRGWDTCCLGDVVQKIESGWSPVCDEGQADANEWGVLKLGAVTTCRYLDTESKALPADVRPRPELEVKAGDLLFTRKNTYDLVAATALVYTTRPKLMISDLIFRLRLKNDAKIISEYLWALLSNNGKRKQIQSLAGGSSGSMPNISKSKLMEQMIEVPPMTLQEKYSKIVHTNYSIRNKLEVTSRTSNILFNSLLNSAFKGEL